MMDEAELRETIRTSGGSFRRCPHCGDEFVVGLPYQKRTDSKFCTFKCSWDFNNARRSFLKSCQQDGVAQ